MDFDEVDFKQPTGLVTRKKFPYYNHFWDDESSIDGYYIGLTPDSGMSTVAISRIMQNVLGQFRKSFKNQAKIYVSHKYSNFNLSESNEINLKNLTSDLASPWYIDEVWMIFYINETRIIIEPESDGTEIGILFSGNNSEDIYKEYLNKLKNLFHKKPEL